MRYSWILVVLLAACGGEGGDGGSAPPGDLPALPDTGPGSDTDPGHDLWVIPGADVADAAAPADLPPSPDVHPADGWAPGEVKSPGSCGFIDDFSSWEPPLTPPDSLPEKPGSPAFMGGWVDPVAHPEPPPEALQVLHQGTREELVLPGYHDDMPLFERALPWEGARRCFELPHGAVMLSEAEAWGLYKDLAEKTTGVKLVTTLGWRSVVGLRGASPGTFDWNGNPPNRFNDTLVLLWIDGDGQRRVREHAAHTDTGPYDFGWHNSSSLRPNRRYDYANGWHKGYSALQIQEEGYRVRDDTNKNGHWDSDRNGWLPPEGEDHDRDGSAHNIHCGNVDGPLLDAPVANTSAGCQVIPGIESWTTFILDAWTGLGDPVDYFLVDARDVDPTVWSDCVPDGSHGCPFRIDGLPFQAQGDTAAAGESLFDAYNCSPADERGAELVWVLTLDAEGILHAAVDDVPGDGQDVDIHLLEGDDPMACLARDDVELTWDITPGRYLIVVDTWFADGKPHPGPFTLDVWLE
ncbi:MAG: hypothetical protein ABIK09_06245 [Pseudomonadota bacterium]